MQVLKKSAAFYKNKDTIKQGDLDLFLVYFMISYLTATTQPLDNQNIWHCVLTVLIKKHTILDYPRF